ncbi:hypothetical protein [Streptomyces sp. XD-27]|uniref:hypothetical protein n=1 Tax=Streptomyces sp. XD-27 TaxID=3062779 RepID=UPI0026F44BC2|nr:hypothetical protein [Streptomyces sp. XD-27]WKX71869.1 hypothetical protein Q3Y56_19965 [Streptomyces sp. XD-27]
MKARWRAAALVMAALLAVGTGCSGRGDGGSPGRDMSPQARDYLSHVLDLMEQKFLRRSQVDWDEVRSRTSPCPA